MKDKIQQAASVLIGLPLWDAGRASDLVWFIFGDRRMVRDYKGHYREMGEFSLHVQCAWRMVQGEKTVAGNRDLYYPAGWDDSQEFPKDFHWDVQGANCLDRRLKHMFHIETNSFIVQSAQAGLAGALQIFFENETVLEIFPNDSFEGERWRLFRPHRDELHFVVSGKGIDPELDWPENRTAFIH